MSIDETHKKTIVDEANQLGYKLFREESVRRFNPSLFAVRREDGKGWFLVELKEGRWTCDCNAQNTNDHMDYCAHVYAALLSSAVRRTEAEELSDTFEERTIKCRYCGSPDCSRVGYRYNSHGIARRYLCNECRRKFSVPYVEPQATLGAPSGTLWLLSQVAMLTSKLTDLLRDLDERIVSGRNNDLLQGSGAGTNG
jgi:transposase-like protein